MCEDRVVLSHWTFKRYIAESKHFELVKEEFRITSLCLVYLSWPLFDKKDSKNDSEETSENELDLRDGSYAFAHYAVAEWPNHLHKIRDLLRQLATQHDAQSVSYETETLELCEAAEQMVQECQNDLQIRHAGTQASHSTAQLEGKLHRFLTEFGGADDLQSLWAHVDRHHEKSNQHSGISLSRLRSTMAWIQRSLEELPEAHQSLELYYGPNLFRCPNVTCFYFHEGFLHQETRDEHVKRSSTAGACDMANTASFQPDPDIKVCLLNALEPATPSFPRKRQMEHHEKKQHGQRSNDFDQTRTKEPTGSNHADLDRESDQDVQRHSSTFSVQRQQAFES
ncbi:hypothetical protein AYL99_11937 [Fonsecaea erecta]|uniref:Uncharacterized protein n=1 Tax=Fonsecaea erecta TaxID=1367422 RepID=A0A178Z484_9EURO|nr:hypothetical protein AYL99_11937 [Fonsecaea erecta]OAP53915.1 hypothetical protein AYL99_11937 [Fonsecaea erecta]